MVCGCEATKTEPKQTWASSGTRFGYVYLLNARYRWRRCDPFQEETALSETRPPPLPPSFLFARLPAAQLRSVQFGCCWVSARVLHAHDRNNAAPCRPSLVLQLAKNKSRPSSNPLQFGSLGKGYEFIIVSDFSSMVFELKKKKKHPQTKFNNDTTFIGHYFVAR